MFLLLIKAGLDSSLPNIEVPYEASLSVELLSESGKNNLFAQLFNSSINMTIHSLKYALNTYIPELK